MKPEKAVDDGGVQALRRKWTDRDGEAADFLDYLTADLDVPGPTGSAVEVIDSGRHFVTFSWSPPKQTGGEPILAYRVEICRLGDDEWTKVGLTPTSSIDAFHVIRGCDVRLRVTARNRHGWGQQRITDAVHVPPHEAALPQFIVGLPSRLTRLIGDDLVLTCEVQSTSPVAIEWLCDSEPLATADDRKTVTRDGNVSRLTLRNLKRCDSARYSCKAENSSGKALSHGHLVVDVSPEAVRVDRKTEKYQPGEIRPPEIWLRLRDRRLDVGDLLRLSCRVFGVPLPEVTWKKDGRPIHASDRLTLLEDGPYHTLEIRDALPEDAGEYEAAAESSLGVVSTNCVVSAIRGLHGYKEPSFDSPIETPSALQQGGDLRLVARVSGFPMPKVQWFRNGELLRSSKRYIMTLSPDGDAILTVVCLTQRDTGVYKCRITNPIGSATESVQMKFSSTNGVLENGRESNGRLPTESADDLPYSKEPAFVSRPIATEVEEGEALDIICEVVGDPKPEVSWERNFLKSPGWQQLVWTRRGYSVAVSLPVHNNCCQPDCRKT